MAMDTPTTMTTEAPLPELDGMALARLLQLCSPGLPIGAFAYSQGLEQAVAAGWITDAEDAGNWLDGLLEHAFATLDLPVLARLIAAWRAQDLGEVERWSGWLLACRPSRETRAEDRQLGGSLARLLVTLGIPEAGAWAERDDVTHAAMFALAAARYGIPTQVAMVGYGFAWAESLASAAVRLVPLGQSAGQRLLAAAGEAIPLAVANALTLEDDELGSATPGQAVASALHETLYSRLFRS
jgi:urease accessory protein